MEKKVLIVVDMQKDFVDGALGTPQAQQIVPAVVQKINSFQGDVIFTYDTHGENYLETQEGKYLPVMHCVKGTAGWALDEQVQQAALSRDAVFYEKPTFGSTALACDLKERYQNGGLESIELIGLCTDICVVSNALLLKAFMPELPVSVDASCCAGVTPDKHQAALETMRSCQILVYGD